MTIDQLTPSQKVIATFIVAVAAEKVARDKGLFQFADLCKMGIEKLRPELEKIKMKHTLKCQKEENQKLMSS